MAVLKLVGNNLVITSSLKLEDIKTIKKYRPNALILKGGEDGKEPVFALSIGEGKLNSVGASFNQETREGKLATLTVPVDYNGEDVLDFITDKYGEAITNLFLLENLIMTSNVMGEIREEKENIKNSISIIE